MKTKTALITMLAIAGLQGCVVKSIHPFYHEKDVIYKSEITGRWMDTDSSVWIIKQHQKTTGLFKPDKPDNSYDITFTTDKGTASFSAHLFELNKQLYLDFYPLEIACGNDMANFHVIGVHSIAKVSFPKGKIAISWYNEEWLSDLFEKNKIRIAHESVPYSDDASGDEQMQYLLTASTDELQKFVMKYGSDPEAFKNESKKMGLEGYSFILSRNNYK